MYSGFAMKLINHDIYIYIYIYMYFLPQRTGIFRPPYLLPRICMLHEGCSDMIQSMSLHRAAGNTSLLHHSVLYLLIIIRIPWLLVLFTLDVLHTLWCMLVRQKFSC